MWINLQAIFITCDVRIATRYGDMSFFRLDQCCLYARSRAETSYKMILLSSLDVIESVGLNHRNFVAPWWSTSVDRFLVKLYREQIICANAIRSTTVHTVLCSYVWFFVFILCLRVLTELIWMVRAQMISRSCWTISSVFRFKFTFFQEFLELGGVMRVRFYMG